MKWSNTNLPLRAGLLALTLLVTAALGVQYSSQPQAQPAAVRYVVTIKPLEFILREVCAGRAEVGTLLKPGTNAHTYDPSPADAKAVQTASALVWIGEDYDGWAAKLNAQRKIKLLPLLPREMLHTLSEPCTLDHGHGAQPHNHDIDDPHFFTDPLAVKALLPGLVRELTRLDPAGKPAYEAGAAAFGKQLDSLHNELSNTLYRVKGEGVIQFHASFNYFIARYGLRNAGLIQQSPGKEPSPKELQAIVKQIKQEGIKALFSETLLPKGPAAVIGEAAGVPVFELDPSCGTSERSYADYAAWLRHNAAVFAQALI